MSIIGWLILGLASGFIASRIADKAGDGLMANSVSGLLGACLGGVAACHIFGGDSLTRLNLYSMSMALGGAIVVLLLYHVILHRRVA